MADYTMADLIVDVLPRIARTEKQSGITLFQAASSVQSLIYKTLLARKSDLIASGELDLEIPALGCSAALPDDFMALAEKPKSEDIYTERRHHMRPSYLNDDDHDDYRWWEWYMFYGESYEPATLKPQKFKIIGTTMYVRPKVIVNIKIVGKYFAKVLPFSLTTDVIPWNGFFDEVFRTGVIRIISKGIEIVDADKDFIAFIDREVHGVVNIRATLIPNTRRLKRGSFL